MDFDRLVRLALLALIVPGCAAERPQYALRAPVTRDRDLDDVLPACAEGNPVAKCTPEPYESSFAWDAVDNTLFRPVAQFFAVRPGGEAPNVNSFDEVPDSSWFTQRIGAHPMTPEEVAKGPCIGGPELDPNDPDGSWLIDAGKDNGANPGF